MAEWDPWDPESPEQPLPSEWDDDPTDAPVEETASWAEVEAPEPRHDPVPHTLDAATAVFATVPASPRPLDEQRLLEAIGDRATGLRLRRRSRALGVMSALLVVLLVTTALRLTGDTDDLSTTAPSSTLGNLTPLTDPPVVLGVDDPTTTIAPPPRLTPITPFASTTTLVARGTSTTRLATTTTADTRGPGDRPDGVPGWTNDVATCTEGYALPADGGAPRDDLSISITVSGDRVRAGEELGLTLTVTNEGSAATLYYRTPTSRTDAWFLNGPARAASASLDSGESQSTFLVIPPGTPDAPRQATLSRTVRAVRCGDTSTDPAPGLVPSTYLIGASLDVSLSPTGTLRPWRTPQEQVTVTG